MLKALPNHAAALQFYGILQHQLGHSDRAIELMRRSIALSPGQAGPHLNLGNVLLESNRYPEAAEAYASASDLMPENEELTNNLAILHKAQGDHEAAEALYRRALSLNPQYFEAHNNLGHLLVSCGRVDEALQHYFRALTLAPHNAESMRLLGLAYGALGELDKAAEVYRQWAEQEPENPAPRHYLAACLQQGVPERAADDYVAHTFDAFAASFDAKLMALQYRAPQLISEAVEALPGLPLGKKQLRILDAGCGTGLCGPLLTQHASELIGVDLSGEMLKRAEPRQLYDQLIKAELTAFLQAREAGARPDRLGRHAVLLRATRSRQPGCPAGAGARRLAGVLTGVPAGRPRHRPPPVSPRPLCAPPGLCPQRPAGRRLGRHRPDPRDPSQRGGKTRPWIDCSGPPGLIQTRDVRPL